MSLYLYPNPHKVKHQVNPNVKYGFWVIIRCQCKFTNCAKCTTLVGMSTMEKAVDNVRAGGSWRISASSVQFC